MTGFYRKNNTGLKWVNFTFRLNNMDDPVVILEF